MRQHFAPISQQNIDELQTADRQNGELISEQISIVNNSINVQRQLNTLTSNSLKQVENNFIKLGNRVENQFITEIIQILTSLTTEQVKNLQLIIDTFEENRADKIISIVGLEKIKQHLLYINNTKEEKIPASYQNNLLETRGDYHFSFTKYTYFI